MRSLAGGRASQAVSMPRCGAFGVRRRAGHVRDRVHRRFNAPVWGLRCATRLCQGSGLCHCLVSMPRCGAFGVRLFGPDLGPRVEECFNAPVWGLRCATDSSHTFSSAACAVSMPRCGAFGVRRYGCFRHRMRMVFQCPGVGPSVCDLPTPVSRVLWLSVFQCPGVGPSVCDLVPPKQGEGWQVVFQCPGVGPSVCDRPREVTTPGALLVSMPRCGAFGVRRPLT